VVAEELAPLAHRAARAAPEGFGVDLPDAVRPDRPTPAEAREAVSEAVVAAHREVVRYAVETGGEAYTTVVAGLYDGAQLHYGWVGDSRAYVVNRETETVEALTTDHSVVAEERRAGAIDEVEAATHPRGNEITRALGGTAAKTPETATVEVETASVPLYAEDVVVVTSDGLLDAQTDAPDLFREYRDRDRSDEAAAEVREAVVTDADVRDVALAADSLDEAVVEYVRLANDLGGKDNLSVALFADDALPPTPEDPPTRAYDPADGLAERETTIRPVPATTEDDETADGDAGD
jgi:serine/threonine protein phosphatase PrpC